MSRLLSFVARSPETEPGHEVGPHSETAEHHHLLRRGAPRDRRRLRARRAPKAAIRARDRAASDPAGQHLQLGVGQSVIVDLPEEAGEIYVGDPNTANAIVRSARRIYISGVANGQTSIFALARDGRRIAVFQVSVGRDVGELSNLLNTAIPGNEIHVRTVENTIILTGSVASAEEAQKALDIADGFVNDSPSQLRQRRPSISVSSGSAGGARRLRRQVQQPARKGHQRLDDPRG